MRFSGVVNATQLAIIEQALDAYCTSHGIEDQIEREDIALTAMALIFDGAASFETIMEGLERANRHGTHPPS